MLFNRIRIGDDGSRMASPVRPRKRGMDDRVTEHGLVSRPKYTGMWDNSINNWRLALGAMLRPSAARSNATPAKQKQEPIANAIKR